MRLAAPPSAALAAAMLIAPAALAGAPAPRVLALTQSTILTSPDGTQWRALLVSGQPGFGLDGRVRANFYVRPLASGFDQYAVAEEADTGWRVVNIVGGEAPGAAPLRYETLLDVHSPGTGMITFPGTVAASFPADVCLWTELAGSVQLLARGGQPIPGQPPGTSFGFVQPFGLSVQPGFGTLFGAQVNTPTGPREVLFRGMPGSLTQLVRTADPATGLTGGTFAGFFEPAMNSDGAIAFRAQVQGAVSGFGIWTGQPGAITPVIVDGASAPGTPPGVTFSGIGPPTLAAGGVVAASCYISGPGVNAFNSRGIWAGAADTLQLVARAGNPVPGLPVGWAFSTTLNDPVCNASGHVVFKGFANMGITSTLECLWTSAGGTLSTIARRGDPAPGFLAGETFFTFDTLGILDDGAVYFTADVFRPGISGNANRGLWRRNTDGSIVLVLREGQTITVAPGDNRTIVSFAADLNVAGRNGRKANLLPTGEHAAVVQFSDSRSAILSWAPLTPACPGDADADGGVGLSDISVIIQNWGRATAVGDLDADGGVGLSDISVVIQSWGATCP